MTFYISVFDSLVGRVEDHQSNDGGFEPYPGRVLIFLIFSILARSHELLLAFLVAKLDIFSSLQPSEKKCVKNYKENLLATIRNSFIIL